MLMENNPPKPRGQGRDRVSLRTSGHTPERVPESDQDRASGRVLGLDFGSRRIGVAVSDELGLLAQPVLTLVRKNLRQDLRSLARLMRKYGCAEVVVGDPLYPSGDPSPQAGRARSFAQELERETGAAVHLWDERLSTAEAHRYLDESGRPPNARRAVIDQVAAVLILQSFLDARASKRDAPA
jgi:putative holliday junction resolvase